MNKRALILLAFGLAMTLGIRPSTISRAQETQPANPTRPIKPDPGSVEALTPLKTSDPLLGIDNEETPYYNNINSWYRMVFNSYRDGNWEIYSALGDYSSFETRLTNTSAADYRPKLNRDSTKIVFDSNRTGSYQIHTMNFDGSNVQQLTDSGGANYAAAWSPDGNRIAFTSSRDGYTAIYVMNANGTVQTRLTNSALGDTQATWVPDGSGITWVHGNAIWTMNADGGNPHALTSSWPYMSHPSWSPDGARLAFDCDADGDTWNEIVAINADGSGWQIIADNGGNFEEVWMGSWSEHQERIVYSYVKYIAYQGSLYLDKTEVRYCIVVDTYTSDEETSMPLAINSTELDLYPDWQSLDRLAPTSHVLPLPMYSRQSGFTVNWVGSDAGPAGVFGYGISTRIGSTGTWSPLHVYESTQFPYPNPFLPELPADTLYFRSQAQDRAGNWEPVPSDSGDAWTRVYYWLLNGLVKDNRGATLSNSSVTMSPAPWEGVAQSFVSGSYQFHSRNEDDHIIQASHVGYGNMVPLTVTLNADTTHDLYLPPADNILSNGDFEASPNISDDWVISGTLSATATAGYSGEHAISLGKNCPMPCLGEFEYPPSAYAAYQARMVIDSQNNVHMIGNDSGSFYYGVRAPEGTWSAPVNLGNFGHTGSSDDVVASVAIDADDTLHVVVTGMNMYYRSLFYLQKTRNGEWSSPKNLADGFAHRIIVDAQGNLHVVYSNGFTQYYQKRLANGTWLPPQSIGSIKVSAMTSGADGTLYMLYNVNFDAGLYIIQPDGAARYDQTINLGLNDSECLAKLQIDSEGRLHVLVPYYYTVSYKSRDVNGVWSPTVTFEKTSFFGMAIDHKNGVHIFMDDWRSNGDGHLLYYYKPPSGKIFTNRLLPINSSRHITDIDLATDQSDNFHLAWAGSSGVYQTTAHSPNTQTQSMSQVIDLAGIHHPTLDFQYKLDDTQWEQTGFDVQVTSVTTTTQLLSATQKTDWTHAWADLSPWAGQIVTVTFTLRQAAGEPYVNLALDDISVGSWLTPIAMEANPPVLDAWASTAITITGQNFILTPTVQLNDIPITDVVRLDENTLRLNLPTGLPPGLYQIRIINPDGQETISRVLIRVGKQVFLPSIWRD